ncbi:hypothetical protein [Streptomyces sp. B3I7]|nr:hypothetical protein [Streptomyces sp. B3I7]
MADAVVDTAGDGVASARERAEIPGQQSAGRAVGEEAGEPAGDGART